MKQAVRGSQPTLASAVPRHKSIVGHTIPIGPLRTTIFEVLEDLKQVGEVINV